MSFIHTRRIALKNVRQSFIVNDAPIHLFENVNLTVEQGQSYAITGPSGTGKSSLLMLLSGLEKPSAGEGVYVCSTVNKTAQRDGAQNEGSQNKGNQIEGSQSEVIKEQRLPLDALRANIGFIFQQFHLLPELTALHNVALPLKLRGEKNAQEKATYWLEKVGLAHRLTHKPKQLSGGEQQRVAIARALIFEPKFIFADEPTGNLDVNSAYEVADMLFSCCEENGAGLVIVTHNEALAQRADQVLRLERKTKSASGSNLKSQLRSAVEDTPC